jgi:hypothetical protein
MTESLRLPYPHSYWVIPGELLAGRYPGSTHPFEASEKLTRLVEVGIRCVINLQEETERNYDGDLFVPYAAELKQIAARFHVEATMIRMPIRDMSIPSHEQMVAILDEIDHSIETDKPVYVHCWGGKGRTGTVVGCYLARHGIATDWETLRKIQSLRRRVPDWKQESPQSLEQFAMVRSWKVGE